MVVGAGGFDEGCHCWERVGRFSVDGGDACWEGCWVLYFWVGRLGRYGEMAVKDG